MDYNIKRFYWLDILRGVAALIVVFWHWQHFFFDGTFNDMMGKIIDKSHYPLYHIFRPFYGQGWRAVELFFTLSGFIFFWLYSSKISNKEVGFEKYLTLRISRLYPLHVLTLFVVIIAQYCLYHTKGYNFVYNDFSAGAFLANITLTFDWFSSAITFNGPSWSLSVEMFLYLVFFLFCIIKFNRWWYALPMIFIGYLLRGTFLDSMGTGIMSFFAGGCIFYLFNWQMNTWSKKWRIYFAIFSMPLIIIGSIIFRYIAKIELPAYFFELAIFPSIILTISLLEASLGYGIGKHLAFIGDISYSTYLWHFPLQIIFVLAVNFIGKTRAVFYSPVTLLLFFVVLITISILSYHYFEKPMQNYLRQKWNNRRLSFRN